MTTELETKQEDKVETDEHKSADAPSGDKGLETPEYKSVAEALVEIEKLRSIKAEVIQERDRAKAKLRTVEETEEARKATELTEQGKYKELFEEEQSKRAALELTIRDSSVVQALTKALDSAETASVDTALALIDRSLVKYDDDGNIDAQSVVDAIAKVKEQHSVLFKQKKGPTNKGPTSKRASEDPTTGGFTEELKKLMADPKTRPADLSNLRAKYNKPT